MSSSRGRAPTPSRASWTPTVGKTIDADGADQSATGTCTDLAGNTAS